ncbi:hypothetical protein Ae201684P_013426 [Aphanomyces euteiches]|nr:hypothetical protein Ae201684P_013426 [Aphanomyces euteiches]
MIEVLTEQNKRLLDRIKLIEAELASSSNAAKEAVVERVVKRDAAAIHSTSNKPAKKREVKASCHPRCGLNGSHLNHAHGAKSTITTIKADNDVLT